VLTQPIGQKAEPELEPSPVKALAASPVSSVLQPATLVEAARAKRWRSLSTCWWSLRTG
jgi:hypothetical protein